MNNQPKKYPHSEVFTRIGLSKIHGIGVFAIKDIPKNTNIFSNDKTKMVWLGRKEINNLSLSPGIKKLYTDFCVLKDGKYGAPENFNSITPGWHMNEPLDGEDSNVYPDADYNFYAKRDIKKGEELVIKYSLFSEHLERY